LILKANRNRILQFFIFVEALSSQKFLQESEQEISMWGQVQTLGWVVKLLKASLSQGLELSMTSRQEI